MISAVIPLYNSENYICDAVDSVFAQGTEVELIIVDDCSTDNSLARLLEHFAEISEGEIKEEQPGKGLKKILSTHSMRLVINGNVCGRHVLVVSNTDNQGVAKTRNEGVLLAKGEYIAFLDADDMWAADKLIKQKLAAMSTQAVICCTERLIINHDGSPTGRVIRSPQLIDLKTLEKSNYINCSSVLIKREIMLRFPMRHSEVHEDYLAWLEIERVYGSAYCINEPLLLYRLSENGKSRNKLKSAQMTYNTYVFAGYGKIRSLFMMLPYMLNGIKKSFKSFTRQDL